MDKYLSATLTDQKCKKTQHRQPTAKKPKLAFPNRSQSETLQTKGGPVGNADISAQSANNGRERDGCYEAVPENETIASISGTDQAGEEDGNNRTYEMPASSKSALQEVVKWREITAENLHCQYCRLYSRSEAAKLISACEKELIYNTGHLAKIQIFGKWIDIPRKQVAHGDAGLAYTFSNNTIPARQWTPLLQRIRSKVECVTGHKFNFVLINRYQDGDDYMGEHRDDEKDLVSTSPIASVSLGQARDFLFRHKDSRGKDATRKIDPIKIELENGSLLSMNYPTNVYWYHSLPKRKKALGVRINMTFRDMVTKTK